MHPDHRADRAILVLAIAASLVWGAGSGRSCAADGPPNLIRNAGFEEGMEGWKVRCDPKMGEVTISQDAHSGKGSLCVRKKVASVKDEYTGMDVSQVVKVQPKTTYVVRVYAKHALKDNIVPHAVRLFITDPRHADQPFSVPVGCNGRWGRANIQYETAADTQEVTLQLALTYSSGTALFDDVLLTPAVTTGIDMDIPALKPLCLKTPIVEGGAAKAVIVSSNRPAYQALAEKLRARLMEASGADIAIRLDSETNEADWQASHVITLGNLMSNKLVERLYCRWYVRTDAWYPGKGGYEVRTVHDPWGTGKNVILLGGSDDDGVAAAVGEFLKLVQPGKDLVLDKQMTLKLSPDLDREEFAKTMDEKRLDALQKKPKNLNMRALMSTAGHYAFNYYASGNEQWVPLFKDCVLEHSSRGELGYDTHMDLWYTLIGFDLVEESPALSEADRVALTKYLLFLCRSEEGANKRWFLGAIGQNTIRHNHVMLGALDAFFGGEYFKKYYKLEEADDWIANAALAFKGQERHSKTQCDANGYESFAVSLAMVYALAKPDPAFFESGAARKATERLVRCLDNMVYGAAYGDSWDAFWFPRHLLQLAHWHYRDPRYQYLIEEEITRYKRGRWANNVGFFTGGPAEKPTDLDGVQAIPVDPEFFTYSTKDWKVNVPLEKSFDKVAFREKLDPAAQYLLLDGLNIGSHGHMDANAIVEFSDRERVFLVDMSYTDGVMLKDHNGVTAIKDGLASPLTAGAELVSWADLPSTGFSRTTLYDHAGTDWTRNLFWRKGEYFVALDEMKAREEGDFNFQCLWRALGKPKLEGDVFTAEQVQKGEVEFVPDPAKTGRTVALFRTAEANLEFTVDLPAGKCALAVFGKGRDGGSDSVWIDLDGKRIPQSFNLPTSEIGTSSAKFDLSEPTPNIELAAAGPHRFLVTLREGPGVLVDRLEFVPANAPKVVVRAEQGRSVGGFQGERHDLLVLRNAGGVAYEMASAGPGFGHYWKAYPYAEPDVTVLRQKATAHLAAGQRHVFLNLFYATGGDPSEEYRVVRSSDDCAVISGKEEAVIGVTSGAGMYLIRRDGFSLVNAKTLVVGAPVFQADKPATLEFDLNGNRMVVSVSEDSEIRFPGSGPEATVDGKTTPVEGKEGLLDLRIAKGTHTVAVSAPDAWKARYRDAFGALVASLTKSAPKPEVARIAKPTGRPMATSWRFAAQGGIRCIAFVDVDKDGRMETVVGSADKNVYLLDPSGAKRWSFAAGGAVNAVCACDLDGDGGVEIVAGGEDANVFALDVTGKVKWQFTCPPVDAGIPYTHYGSKGAVRTLWAGAMEKGGKPVVVVGPESGYVFCLDAAGKALWKSRCGDGVFTSMEAADLDGDGNKEVLGGSALCSWSACMAIKASGKEQRVNGLDGWGTNLTALAVGDADRDGKPDIAAGTSKSTVYLLDNTGKTRWTFALGDAPSCLCMAGLNGDGKDEILAGSPSFYVYALSLDGKLMWRVNLGDEVTALCAKASKNGPVILAGTKAGDLFRISGDGSVLGAASTKGAVTCIAPDTGVLYGTAEGEVGLLGTD